MGSETVLENAGTFYIAVSRGHKIRENVVCNEIVRGTLGFIGSGTELEIFI